MSKRLVVCCDGTWNTPDQLSGGRPAPTNVAKVALAVAPTDSAGRVQRLHYQRGVGTAKGERIRGGAFGFGLSRDVCDTYRFLVRNFEPGDELFFFGFSRGAYTARSTVGLVRNAGILRREHVERVDEAYALYRSKNNRTHPKTVESELFRRTYSHETRIRFLGVWDTVGSLGIPFSGSRVVNLINRRWQFHDTVLSSTVDAAFHALAIDEKRGPFRPALWQEARGTSGQRREQVWFTGAHCDVGGGTRDPALSEIALLWMVDRARSCGLAFSADAFAPLTPGSEAQRHSGKVVAPDARGPIHESRKGPYRLLQSFIRPLGVTDAEHEYAASSAVERHKETAGYRPQNLVTYLGNARHRIMPVTSELPDRVVHHSGPHEGVARSGSAAG
jgi:uncharacterized protein (DUF2235 family)